MGSVQKQQFLESAAQKNILGAYLIVCERNAVALRLAEDFLMRLYCPDSGCASCPECKKVREGHIDIMRLAAPKVDEIRSAILFISQKPVDANYKTVLIEAADDMNASASNTLLKTLEEPPTGGVIILLARSVSNVLPTIVSRCSVVHLSHQADIQQRIASQLGVDKAMARILAGLSGGFLDEAQRIHEDKQMLDLRLKTIEISEKLLAQSNYAVTAYADFLESNKDDIVFLLGIMQSYFHDVSMLQKTGSEELLANPDSISSIKKNAERFTTGAISNIIKVILEAERRFSFAVNFRLAAEKMLFDILEEKNRW